ncbi:hypothetical protein A1F94_009810 [Pyrenophora tritici-repentis]|nr:hypothetical protein A1F99_117890 [Pyrenophora tritici-repentis]KAG9379454.1 hypothetical protein A1F94_009810 [Pyrenophora tritici-repentis]KAI0578908.1 hypothetical protein Alg215_06080 [Pyrenophora tritici-repentis]KAI0587940.1 hypothetical protein Alg130_03627 [Pyrenophora tritici-repentis]KAI0612209.1 hypothetical protein TUN205_03577 [Pyrenophora tritici-repentis]
MERMKYENHPLLPSNARQGQPHVLKDGQDIEHIEDGFEVVRYDPRSTLRKPAQLCDFVATILHRIGDHPTALKDFFGPAIKYFKFLRITKNGCFMTVIIWRKDNEVMVGPYNQYPWFHEWELLTKSELSKVAPDGVWKVKWGVQTAVSGPNVDTIWSLRNLSKVNDLMIAKPDPRDPGEAENIAYRLGTCTYANQIWEKLDA